MEMNQSGASTGEPKGMHRWMLWAVILVVAAGVGYGAHQYRGTSVPAGTETPTPAPQPQSSANTTPQNATVEVDITDSGFSPSTVVISQGDTVKFVNKRATPSWPASDVHPTHLACPGFDSLKGLKTGETYSHTFTEVKDCSMHDHLNPSVKGMIVVKASSEMKGGQ